MNRIHKTGIVSAIAALAFCCCGPPAHAGGTETQTQSFQIAPISGDTLTFDKFDGTVPCRALQEVRLTSDWTVDFDFIFTNDADFPCSGTGELVHAESLAFRGAGGGVQCESGGVEPFIIGPNLPPGQTQTIEVIDLAFTDMVSFTTDLDQFIGAPGETVDAVLRGCLVIGFQVACDNTNSCVSLWQGTITLEYVFVEPGCAGDTNGDNVIDVNDLNNVILDWGTDGSASCGDISGPVPGSPPDGIVNVNDLIAVIVGWGACP